MNLFSVQRWFSMMELIGATVPRSVKLLTFSSVLSIIANDDIIDSNTPAAPNV